MHDQDAISPIGEDVLTAIGRDLADHMKGEKRRRFVRFMLAALGGIPWVGGLISAAAALHAEKEQTRVNEFQRQWVEEYTEKIGKLAQSLVQIFDRLDSLDEEIQVRMLSPSYLTLVRKAFRVWDQADTDEKRELIRKLLTNAGASKICPDDLIRLFIDWIDTYHEAHFKVIREVHSNAPISRADIWDNISDVRPRDDSPEGDLYGRLIRDLSIGGVIRQHRQTDSRGHFLKKSSSTGSRRRTPVMKSPFDDNEAYELTQLGRQFVQYTMDELIPRLDTTPKDE